jgi:hypothetical protein
VRTLSLRRDVPLPVGRAAVLGVTLAWGKALGPPEMQGQRPEVETSAWRGASRAMEGEVRRQGRRARSAGEEIPVCMAIASGALAPPRSIRCRSTAFTSPTHIPWIRQWVATTAIHRVQALLYLDQPGGRNRVAADVRRLRAVVHPRLRTVRGGRAPGRRRRRGPELK